MDTAASHYSVLVVEDNQDLVIGLQDLLHHDGYAVTVAGTVAGAIELVRAHHFNAILLDLGLPDGDGLEVLKETQRLDPSLPVVIVTAHISQDRTVGSLAEGAYAYLTKPYDREELRHTLRRAIGVKELAVKVERTEHLLNQSEERLELVIQGSNDGFWDGQVLPDEPWNSPRTPVWWSPRVKTMLGYTDEEFPEVLESWASRLHPEDTDRVFAALTAHIERRDPYDVEYRLLTKAGEYQWFRARGQAIWNDAGQVVRMSGSLQCVTDRKRAEDALRRSEQLLQDVADNTTAVIYVKDADGRFLFTNRRFEQLFHLTIEQIVGHTNHEIFPQEAVGTWDWDLQTDHIYWSSQVDRFLGLLDGARPRSQNDWLALVHPDDRETIVLAMRHALEPQRTDVAFEHRVMRPDGSAQWCVWTGEIIRDHDGKALHILGTVRAT